MIIKTLILCLIVDLSLGAGDSELRVLNQGEVEFLEQTVAPEPRGDENFGSYLRRLQFDFLGKPPHDCSVEISGDLAEISVISAICNLKASEVFKDIKNPNGIPERKSVSLWRLLDYMTLRAQMDVKSKGSRRFVIEGRDGEKIPIRPQK